MIDSIGNVGVGTLTPAYKLHVLDSLNGLRVETASGGETIASFGGLGHFQIDTPITAGGRFVVKEDGNVGINTTSPGAKLQVSGGDVAITTQANGLILRATNGAACFRLTVNNVGALSTAPVGCP